MAHKGVKKGLRVVGKNPAILGGGEKQKRARQKG